MRLDSTVLSSSLLARGKRPWHSYALSITLQCLAVLALVWIPVIFPEQLDLRSRFQTILLAMPRAEVAPPPAYKPKVKKQPAELAEVKPPVMVEPPAPKRRVLEAGFTAPVARPAARKANPADAPKIQAPAPQFDSRLMQGSSAIPTLRKPREAVQTGGFGDPNGVPSSSRVTQPPNVAQVGSFELPPGPGHGNGTGGADGARGTVASAGFGNGVATEGTASGSRGSVRTGAFGDQRPAATAPEVRRVAAREAQLEPVEILAKPRPAYTEAARKAKIEGEVLLNVLFTASGEVRVLGVIRGLGHGLDESAVAAARQIRFRPARRDGQPVDTTGTVHITFQLAQ